MFVGDAEKVGEFAGPGGAFHGGLGVDGSALDVGTEGLVHGDHAIVPSGLNDGIDLVDLAFADEVADGKVDVEDFVGEYTAGVVAGGDEGLGDDAGEDHGELGVNLLLLGGGKDVDDAGDGVGGVLGVEGGEDEVSGFGEGEGEGDGFDVAHFPDHNDVGGLAEDAEEGLVKGVCVFEDFALVDDAVAVPVEVFDGIFEADDVGIAMFVDVIDHRGEGGGFATACGSGDEEEAVGLEGEVADDVGEAESGEGGDGGGDAAGSHGEGVALVIDVEPEAGQPLEPPGEVDATAFPKLFGLGFVEDGEGEAFGIGGGEGVCGDGFEAAVKPHLRGGTGGQEQIGCTG